jgi:hypothetical protein
MYERRLVFSPQQLQVLQELRHVERQVDSHKDQNASAPSAADGVELSLNRMVKLKTRECVFMFVLLLCKHEFVGCSGTHLFSLAYDGTGFIQAFSRWSG